MAENVTEFTTILYSMNLWNLSEAGNGTTSAPVQPCNPGYYEDVSKLLWKIIPPFLIIFGTTGNLLTVVVILRTMKKTSSTSLYLLTLAISDTAILWCGPLRNWISNVWDKDIRFLSDGACKIQLYLTYATIHFSSGLLVAITVERTINVVLPHKVKINCTRRKAGIVILLLFVFTFGINIVTPIIQGLEGYRGKTCAPTTKEYMDFRDNIWQWIDFCMAFAIPFIFLLSGNSMIIVYLYKSRDTHRKLSNRRGQSDGKSGGETTALFVLMIALCSIFLLTMFPVTGYQIYYPYRLEEIVELYGIQPIKVCEDYHYLLLQHAIVNIVGYTNATINFVLYVFIGPKFRNGLMQLFQCNSGHGRSGGLGRKIRKSSEDIKTRTTMLQTTFSHKSNDDSEDPFEFRKLTTAETSQTLE